ncbi:uncharacterized protein SPAPADRAFT_67657 [Spathaspora passalidarum NRRL Y-27907]|uniref:Uncharacterized protein n=1 Tax=Spathaspora passalidarum (strain NRRL Y-27907 / 11-Y1) TaxID=619300 RepID=G3AQS0_SPAPN|nr:uncharacterized protein SPAPADRAFT_67657 [Spathaspora passalidarum NRRL Y-27907]EGW31617.1 hypothetical protein SPAPADRAFT_67657 [Spathaspora passalidarum NRRL Y-27907]
MSILQDSSQLLTQKYDICVLGQDHSGKSALILHYLYHTYIEDADTSMEQIYTKSIRHKNRHYDITILDSHYAGDMYSNSQKMQIMNTSTVVLVYSTENLDSFLSVQDCVSLLATLTTDLPAIAVIGTTVDNEFGRQVSYEDGQNFANSVQAISFHECSIVSGQGIQEAFETVVDKVVRKKASDSALVTPASEFDELNSSNPLVLTMSAPSFCDDNSIFQYREKEQRPSKSQTASASESVISQVVDADTQETTSLSSSNNSKSSTNLNGKNERLKEMLKAQPSNINTCTIM